MHVLMVSLDTTVLTPAIGDARERHEAYAEQVGRISMVVCNRRGRAPLPDYRSRCLTARATESGSFFRLFTDLSTAI